jgi:hypothetical protein
MMLQEKGDEEECCKECYYSPLSHSFKLISNNGDEDYFYCCPSAGKKYDDEISIEQHILIELNKINKPYILIIDAQAFRLRHTAYVDIIMKLMHTWRSLQLKHIVIINRNLIFRMKVNYIWSSIPTYIRKKIIIDWTDSFANLLAINEDAGNVILRTLY